AAAGESATVTVTALDAFGNVVPGYRGTVRFTSSDADATLPASYTFTASDNGVRTFQVIFRTAGTQGLTARDSATGSVTVTGSISVAPAAAFSFTVTAN